MMRKTLVFLTMLIFGLSMALASCVTTQVKPTDKNFVKPKIALDEFSVPQYDGYWYFSGKVEPTKGEAGDRGAPLPMSFLFSITNPNEYPIQLNGIRFSVVFDKDFNLITYNSQDTIWIPAGKTNEVRATTLITARSALLSLMVTGGFKLKERGWSPWDALERWWKGVPDGSVPVDVAEATFTFSADGVTKVYPVEVTSK
ncbi:MAG: LEA type 2 family protein [Desulfatiglandaceae bacterium]